MLILLAALLQMNFSHPRHPNVYAKIMFLPTPLCAENLIKKILEWVHCVYSTIDFS